MKVFVYGTLKKGYGNNVLLGMTKYLGEGIVHGFKLYNAGFPVARRSEKDSIVGEIYEIDDKDEFTLNRLDRLEANGIMYNRVEEQDVQLYLGADEYWPFHNMDECPKNENGNYYWKR